MGQVDSYLFDASEEGDFNKAKRAIEEGANVNAKGEYLGDTPLHKASESGHEAVVSLLLENGANVNAKGFAGWTPLHNASRFGYDAVVSLLLEKHADVNAQSNLGDTSLHLASSKGHEAVVALLLENGADVDVKDTEGRTPFYIASKHGHKAVVSLLLEKGADPTITNNKGKTPLQIAQEKNNQSCVTAIKEFPQRPVETKQNDAANMEQQFQDECLEKFKTRAALQREMQRLQEIIDAAKDSLDPVANSNAENAKAECEKLLPLFNSPLYMSVPDFEKKIKSLEPEIQALSIGPEKTRKTQELYHLRQRLEQEQKDARINDAMLKKLFFRHFDDMKALVQQDGIIQVTTIVPIFDNALKDMSDFLQLKFYFTAVNAQYHLGTITSDNRKALILSSLEKAKNWCVSPFHVAMYRVALRYALSEKIITQFQFDHLDVAALECDIAHTDYIQAMQTMIHQNSFRINCLEDSFAVFQQAVAKSIYDLQQNLIAVNEQVNDTQTALNNFKATLAYKRKVEAGCSLVSAILNAFSLGIAGSALQGVLGYALNDIADFGDLTHLRVVFAGVSLPDDLLQEIGDTSIHDMFEHGISLVADHADGKLDDVLRNENTIVLMTASAAVFTNTLELDTVDEPVATTVAAPPVAKPQDFSLNASFAQASPSSSSDDLETKLASLEKKRERLINRAKLAKEFGRDVDPILEAIEQIDVEIDEMHDQIHNS